MALQDQLAELEAADLLQPLTDAPAADGAAQAYAFKHGIVQETAIGSLLLRDRRDIHWQVARAYEAIYADQLEENAALLAYHFAEAGYDAALTAKYSVLAGEAAYRRHAHREAIRHYSDAINAQAALRSPDPSQVCALYLRRGHVLGISGQYDKALANYREMHDQAQRLADRNIELAALIAEATIRSTFTPGWNPVQGRELSYRALKLAQALGDRAAEAKVLWNLMLVNHFSGDPQQAIAYGQVSAAIAQELGLEEQLAYTLNDMHRSYAAVGAIASAQAVLAQAEVLWRKLDVPHMLADSLNSAAELLLLVGDYRQALAKAQEGDRVSTKVANVWGQAYSAVLQSLIHAEFGQIDRALEMAQRSIQLSQESGFALGAVYAYTTLSLIHATVGDFDGAAEAAGRAVRLAEAQATSIPRSVELSQSGLALALIHAGRQAEAEAVLKGSGAPVEMDNQQIAIDGSQAALPWLAYGELHMARGEYQDVLYATEGFINGMRGFSIRAFMADVLLLRGRALRALGRTLRARQVFQEAATFARSAGVCRALWPVLVELASLERSAGRPESASAMEAEAAEVVLHIASQIGDQAQRAGFLNLPAVRRLLNDLDLAAAP